MRLELEHERQRLAEHMQLLEEQMAAAKAQADRLDALERRLDAESRLTEGATDALFGTRTPQIRWQSDINPNWSWAVGLEQLQYAGIYNPLDLPGRASSKKPVLAARLTQNRSDGVRSLAALAQELRWDSAGYGANPSATGWALIFAGRQNFGHRNFFVWERISAQRTPSRVAV